MTKTDHIKVLLLSPPYVPYYMRNARCDFVSLSGTQWYPILLGYCGAWLEQCGYEVKFIDALTYGYDHQQVQDMVLEFQPDWLVVYSGRLSEDNDVEFADLLTEKTECQTVIVGPYASIDPVRTLSKTKIVDQLVAGEFEHPVQELIEGLAKEKIKNLVYKEGKEIIRNEPRPYLSTQELDRLPFVSRFFKKHLDVYKYKSLSEPYPYMDILTGRGCQWGRCTYCLWVNSYIKGPVYHCRSMSNVIEELKFIAEEMPHVKSIMLQDDTLTEERAAEFARAKVEAGIKLPWSCYARGNMTYGTLRLMKEAHCLNMHVGFESASNEILKGIKKGITKERMTTFAMEAKKIGLQIHGDFAIGFPGETEQTIKETIRWACAIRPHTVQFQLMIPFEGTPFYEKLNKKDWMKDGLPDYPDLSKEEMERMAKSAYKKFYVSWPYLKQVLRHPRELFLQRMGIYVRAIPSLFWKKYVR